MKDKTYNIIVFPWTLIRACLLVPFFVLAAIGSKSEDIGVWLMDHIPGHLRDSDYG